MGRSDASMHRADMNDRADGCLCGKISLVRSHLLLPKTGAELHDGAVETNIMASSDLLVFFGTYFDMGQ